MTENIAPGGGATKSAGANAASGDAPASSAAGIPFYEKQRQHLKELIARKRTLEKKLAATEDLILAKETDYLESTPSGNIVIGFDNYVKGATAAATQRRKATLADQNRVFSRSSVSYNPAAADAQAPATTPASHAPTPMSSSFGASNRDGPSGAPTPSSAAGGGGGRAGTTKKSKKTTAAAAAAAGGVEDSETDGREAKKVRTSFGARK